MRPALALLLLLLASLTAAPADAQRRAIPDAPDGYTWEADAAARIALLRPDGWFVKKEDGPGNRAVFITKEEIVPGGVFVTGLSVFHVESTTARAGRKPSEYAALVLANIAAKNEELGTFREEFADGITGTGLRVRNVGERTIIVQYYAIADDGADLFWLLAFEAPENEWDAAWVHGERMLKGLFHR